MKTQKYTLKIISLIASGTLLSLMSMGALNAQNEPLQSGKSQHNIHHPENHTEATNHGTKIMGQQDMDQHFLMMMVSHYQAEIAMADLAANKAENPALKTIAQSIQTTQNQAIQDMKAWYRDWYTTELPETTHMEMNHEMPMNHEMGTNHEMPMNHEMMATNHEMPMQSCVDMMKNMMNADLASLEDAEDFDQAFISQMIRLQKMDVMMAAMVLDSSRLELRDLAQSIIHTKSMEIEQLQSLEKS